MRASWFGHTIAVIWGSYLGAPKAAELVPVRTEFGRVLGGG